MRSSIPDCGGEQCAYSSKVENFFSDNDDISTYEDEFFWRSVHMEDVGHKDDISVCKDDIYSESCICGIHRV